MAFAVDSSDIDPAIATFAAVTKPGDQRSSKRGTPLGRNGGTVMGNRLAASAGLVPRASRAGAGLLRLRGNQHQ